MSLPSTAEIQHTLDTTIGAVFIGVVVSAILFGISSLQVYYYYHYYPHDSFLHKFSVGLLWALDTTHLCLTIASTYHYGVRGFGHLDRLDVIILPIKLQTLINVIIILMVQSLYAYRVWLLGGYHHGVLGYFVAGVVLAGFAVGMVLAYETFTVNSWSDIGSVSWAVEASFAASTLIDIVISVAMCFYLRKSKGAESRLNSRLSTLMQYTLSAGVFTSACSVLCLFTFVLLKNTLSFLAVTYILTRLYVNSFMAMMNARQRTTRHNDSTFVLSNHISSVTVSAPRIPRSMGDPENQRSPDKDKYNWVDVPVPELSFSGGSSANTHPPHRNGPVYGSRGQLTYTQQW